jgi:hypothetical protein
MDNHRRLVPSKNTVRVLIFLVAVLLTVPQVRAQQQQVKLSVPYAKAALLSLLAIESDASVSQDHGNSDAELSDTELKIEATDLAASTELEESLTKMLRQIYRVRLQDNDLVRAYEKLMEIESADDASDQLAAKRRKDYAIAQLADSEAAIKQREQSCFVPLEKALRQRSPEAVTACSGWVGKAKISEKHPVESATSDEGPSGRP